MGANPAPAPVETLVQLVLRAHRRGALIQTEEDWHALGLIAARMLFWCGGAIYGCRCEGNEMRFALQVVHASLGTIAHQIAGAYATHLRKTRRLDGGIFRHYIAIPLRDDIFLDDLVFWLHRSEEAASAPSIAMPGATIQVWTTESAYLVPNSLSWINTERVLSLLSVGAPGPATYRRRKSEDISPRVVEMFTRRPQRARRPGPLDDSAAASRAADRMARVVRPPIEAIARLVADYCKVSYDDMLTDSRKRAVSKARVIATVLATRNGATAAAAARLFHRSRSTLIEQAEHYRAAQPEIFTEAESLLEATLIATRE
jgi:hypothetical protein